MSIDRFADWLDDMRMAARQACGHVDIDLGVIWETVQRALPELIENLTTIRS